MQRKFDIFFFATYNMMINIVGWAPGLVNFIEIWRRRGSTSSCVVRCLGYPGLGAADSQKIAERFRCLLDPYVQWTNPQESQIFFY